MGLPKIHFATKRYTSQITLVRAITEIIDGRSVQSTQEVIAKATVQPWKPKSYDVKIEYERSLSYILVHAQIQPDLHNGSYVIYNKVSYRILQQNDYSESGFIEYLCVIDTVDDE